MADQQVKTMEGKLVPILREAVDIIKMVLFKELRRSLQNRLAGRRPEELAMLCGAIVNEVFGTPNPAAEFAAFAKTNRHVIDAELKALHLNAQRLMAPVTDALRVQFLCDHQEGWDTQVTLARAEAMGILLTDRDVPLPRTFIDLARRLGAAHNLITPPIVS